MASCSFKKGTLLYQKFQDYWMFIQKFGIAENTEEYWESMICYGNQLINKYSTNGKRDEYMYQLVMAYILEKEKEAKVIEEAVRA